MRLFAHEADARWRQSASMSVSDNARNKSLHSTPLMCKAGLRLCHRLSKGGKVSHVLN